MLNALIYDDYVHNKGALIRRMQQWPQTVDWRMVTSGDIRNGVLKRTCPDLLIMPGGLDLYYCEKLNGECNEKIREYVHEGGGYLGICAGAYYGCNALNWKERTPEEISGRRELSFIDATATGPIDDFPDLPEEHYWPRSWVVSITRPGHDPHYIHYWGGPHFKGLKEHDNLTVIARFTDLPGTPPAIVSVPYGRGQVVLSSVHFEDEAEDLRARRYSLNRYDFTIPDCAIARMEQDEPALRKLQMDILNMFDKHSRETPMNGPDEFA